MTRPWGRFCFIEDDIRDLADCQRVRGGADRVLHHAAPSSVPRSIADPITTRAANVTGFLNVLVAARDAGVKCFVCAVSCSTYGDHPGLPKGEVTLGKLLSPYAVAKNDRRWMMAWRVDRQLRSDSSERTAAGHRRAAVLWRPLSENRGRPELDTSIARIARPRPGA